jgi:hypothetical protein
MAQATASSSDQALCATTHAPLGSSMKSRSYLLARSAETIARHSGCREQFERIVNSILSGAREIEKATGRLRTASDNAPKWVEWISGRLARNADQPVAELNRGQRVRFDVVCIQLNRESTSSRTPFISGKLSARRDLTL